MKRGRIAFPMVLLIVALATPDLARSDCGPQEITATASADTICVEHLHAYENCCLDLRVEIEAEAFVVDFYESDVGEACDCLCCFLLRYDAYGFAAGHYQIRVWNEDGSVLYGETEVDVEGNGDTPVLDVVLRGDCEEPGAVKEETEVPITWGKVRAEYR